jgi:transposase
VTEPIRVRLEGLPKAVREIAWRAQTRLCARYRRLMAAGKNKPIVVAAIAREMAAFLWAIGHQVEPVRIEMQCASSSKIRIPTSAPPARAPPD